MESLTEEQTMMLDLLIYSEEFTKAVQAEDRHNIADVAQYIEDQIDKQGDKFVYRVECSPEKFGGRSE